MNRKMKIEKAFSKSNNVKEIASSFKIFVGDEENDINNEILKLQEEMKINYNSNNKELNPEDIINCLIKVNDGCKVESVEILNKMSIERLVFVKDICFINSRIMNNNLK